MKNIHVLPTDKPSSIGYDGVKNLHFVNEIIAETWNSCEDNEGETYTQDRERIINTHKNR